MLAICQGLRRESSASPGRAHPFYFWLLPPKVGAKDPFICRCSRRIVMLRIFPVHSPTQ